MNTSFKSLTHLFAQPQNYSIEVEGHDPMVVGRCDILRSESSVELIVNQSDSSQLLITIPMVTGYLERSVMAERSLSRVAPTPFTLYRIARARISNCNSPSSYQFAKVIVQQIPCGDVANHDMYGGHLYSSTPHEDRVAVEDVTGFGFVDGDNNPVIASIYRWVDDFREGRAEVESEEGFGIIDIDGGVVIPAVYESISYNADSGITAARRGGMWAYFSYVGVQLTPFVIDYPDEEITLDGVVALGYSLDVEAVTF